MPASRWSPTRRRTGRLKDALAGSGIEAASGPEGLNEAAERSAEWVMSAIVGAAGLGPTLAAVRRGAMVALATKESLVCAGKLLLDEVQASGAVLLPVDSEHNAIFQALRGEQQRQRRAADPHGLGRSVPHVARWSRWPK